MDFTHDEEQVALRDAVRGLLGRKYADFEERRRTGDWQFQWFWPDKKINPQENTARCMSCHSSQKDRDYLFTARRLPEFRGKPVE